MDVNFQDDKLFIYTINSNMEIYCNVVLFGEDGEMMRANDNRYKTKSTTDGKSTKITVKPVKNDLQVKRDDVQSPFTDIAWHSGGDMIPRRRNVSPSRDLKKRIKNTFQIKKSKSTHHSTSAYDGHEVIYWELPDQSLSKSLKKNKTENDLRVRQRSKHKRRVSKSDEFPKLNYDDLKHRTEPKSAPLPIQYWGSNEKGSLTERELLESYVQCQDARKTTTTPLSKLDLELYGVHESM